MIKTITIPEDLRNEVQRRNLERDSRRDIILYILQNNIDIPEEKMKIYQADYDAKYAEFDRIKAIIEANYVMPISGGKSVNWSLDYATCVLTINLPDE